MNQNEHPIILSLASNTDAERNLVIARNRIAFFVADLKFTRVKATKPIDPSEKGKYLNQLAQGITRLSAEALESCLKQIETVMGRKRDGSGEVVIDIDLMKYDSTLYHEKDWERDYITKLIKEL